MKVLLLATVLALAQDTEGVSIKESLLSKLEASALQSTSVEGFVDFGAHFSYVSILSASRRCSGSPVSVSNFDQCRKKCLEPNCDVIQYSSSSGQCLVANSCQTSVATSGISDWKTWGRHQTPLVYPQGGWWKNRCEGPVKVQGFVASFDACLNKCNGVTAFIARFMSYTTQTKYCRCLPNCNSQSEANVGGWKSYVIAYKPPTKAPTKAPTRRPTDAPTLEPTEQPSAQPTTAQPTTANPTAAPTFPAADIENEFKSYTHIEKTMHCAGDVVSVANLDTCKSLCRDPDCNEMSYSESKKLCVITNRCDGRVPAEEGNDWEHWARVGTSTIYPAAGSGKKTCHGSDQAGFVVRDTVADCEELCSTTTRFTCRFFSYNVVTKKCLVYPNCNGNDQKARSGWRSHKVIT